MRYVVLGCGAIGAAVAARLARDGHDVLVSDPDPAVVAAVRAGGLRVEGPEDCFTVAVPAVAPGDLPPKLEGPVLVAVRAQDMAAAAAHLAGRLDGAGYVVCLRHGLDAGILAGSVGPARMVAARAGFAAAELGPGVVRLGGPVAVLVGELDHRHTERIGLPAAHTARAQVTERIGSLVSHLPGAQVTERILGCLWSGQAQDAVLAATAVGGLPAGVLGDPRYRPLLLEVARQVLAEAPVPPAPAGGFDPADLPGSLARLEQASRRWPDAYADAYLDLAVRHRPSEVPAMFGRHGGALVQRVVELVRAIDEGRRSCSAGNLGLLAAHERLERLGRPLNAVGSVIGAPDRAAAGSLAGRPVAVKDIVAVAGVPTRCGSPASDPRPAAADAVLVRRLREAGAEVFATTQCLEYAAGFAHPEVGDTRNPRDPSRTSGGSSGGSAALVAAEVCDLALGTDTGGSVRIPAAYCGVVGLKPSHGLLPLQGVFPLSPTCDHAGTLTATVAGAADLLAVLADGALPDQTGPDQTGPDQTGPDQTGPDRTGPGPGGPRRPGPFTVGVLAAQLADPSVTPAVHDAVRSALAALGAAGWRLEELTSPWLAELATWEDALAVIVAREAYQVHADRDTSRYAEGTRALLEFGASVSDARYARALGQRAELTAAIDASLAGIDVLAGPTVGYQAPEQDPPFGIGQDNAEGRFTGPYNLTGHPAVSLPVPTGFRAGQHHQGLPAGQQHRGLPAGLQLAGRRGADAALLRVAAAAEHLIARPAGPAAHL